MNVATLPGIAGPSLAMPDIHQGYGFPIGGVAAMDAEQGVVSPGGVGFDINCGVRLVRTTLVQQEVRERLRNLIDQIFRQLDNHAANRLFLIERRDHNGNLWSLHRARSDSR